MTLTKTALHIAAGILIVVALGLLVVGLQTAALLWQIGLVVLTAAMAASLATRWAPEGASRDGEGEQEDDGGG